ncbi:MAG: aldehyde dehydrogenase family protein [Spirochaetaceae bacterium]|nr:MAG: aldehyde dehydrogenase family protein [Spirochaetaceae bacterium]
MAKIIRKKSKHGNSGLAVKNPGQMVTTAVLKARKAQEAWRKASFAKRGRIIGRLAGLIGKHADEIAGTIAHATGKTNLDALSTEVLPSAMAAKYYAKATKRFLDKRPIRAGNLLLSYKRSTLVFEPWGVVGIISPWNYPFGIPFHEVVMALMCGNAVILKVASIAEAVGEHIKKLLSEAGLPADLFHLVHLPGAVAGPAFLGSGINKLFFTGSIPVGKELMKQAADYLIPVCLELGGNDAMIVCEDASLQRAANGALWAGLSNCGQSCGGVQRIYAHKRIADRFGEILAGKLAALRVGRENEFDVDIGAMSTKQQYDTVKSQVAQAVKAGARILASAGKDDPGKLLLPAVLLDRVKPGMRILTEESFGPILVLDTFDNYDEVVARANSTIYGLTASVWSKSAGRAKKLAERLEAGSVMINDHLMSHGLAETHWGGYRQSGIGRSHGEMGFYEMTQSKVVVRDLLHRMPKNMWWYPHSKKLYGRLKGILDVLYCRNPFKKITGLGKIIKMFAASIKKW